MRLPADSGWNNSNKTRIQESFSCLRKHVQRKTHHLWCFPIGMQSSVPPTPATPAKFSLLLKLHFSARRGQGKFLWGKNGKCLCPWIVSGSVWVFLHALRAQLHKILWHMCNQKWRPTGSCRDRHIQPSNSSWIQTAFHEVSIIPFLFKPLK